MNTKSKPKSVLSAGDANVIQPIVQQDQPNAIRRLLAGIFEKKSRILLFWWLLALSSVFTLQQNMQNTATQFFGLTGSREQAISFQHPVEISRINVVEGEKVEQNTQLLEAFRYDLAAKQSIIDENITEIKTRHDESTATTYAILQSLIAERKAKVAEITSRINKLESQYKLGQKLLKDISGPDNPEHHSVESPLLAEIKGLKTARGHMKKQLEAQIRNLEKQLKTEIRPADAQIAEFEKRKLELKRQADELKVVAEFNGSIGRIFFKAGEQVRPFSTILTLHDEQPSFVKGYIHEQVLNTIKVGQSVWLQSIGASSRNPRPISGVVESIGSQVMEYPDRLKCNQMVSVWGREVVIRLVEHNQFLLNEKVRIFLKKPESLSSWVYAIFKGLFYQCHAGDLDSQSADLFSLTYNPIRSSVADLNSTEIEASGIVWDKNTRTYLVVNDESKHKTPSILEMNRHGEIMSRLTINGTQEMDDLESISLDPPYIYIASSLSNTKNAEPKSKRRKMIRLERTRDGLLSRGEIDLYRTLNNILESGITDTDTTQFLHRAIYSHTLEIESHSIVDDILYIGFKKPLDQHDNAVVLKVSGIAALFAGQPPIASSIWLSLNLRDPVSGQPTALSDMTLRGDQLFLLSVLSRKKNLVSHFWHYNIANKRLSLIASFPNKRAEGITFKNDNRTAMIVFDAGGKAPSEFILKGVIHEDH